jgi:flagellar motility protein MotE (MotC chaperone)
MTRAIMSTVNLYINTNALCATAEHLKVAEELHQARVSEEDFRKLSETLEAQLSQLEEAHEKLVANLEASRVRCSRFYHGYCY